MSTASLRTLLDSAHEAFVCMDSDGRILEWNRAAASTFGWERGEVVGRTVADVVVPERLREAHRRGLSRYLATGSGPLVDRRVEVSAVHREGREFPVEMTIAPLTRDGTVVFNAFLHDISEREADRQRLQEARNRFEGAFAHAPIGMTLVSPEGRFLEVNAAFCRMLGRSEDELLTSDFQTLTHPDDLEADLAGVGALLAGETERFTMDKRYCLPEGRTFWARLTVSLVRDDCGEPLYFVSQIEDIDTQKRGEEQLREYTERLQRLSLLDPLTGLRNMREFQRTLDSELERARRHATPFAVMLLDVAGFRAYNHEHGQGAGDRALQQLGARLEATVRCMDVAARIGGDEMGVILPETDHDTAQVVAERVRAALDDTVPGLTVVTGVAVWPDAGDGKDELLLRADLAMHAETRSAPREAVPAADAGARDSEASRIRDMLALARGQLGMGVAYLAQMTDDEQVFTEIDGSLGDTSVPRGTAIPRAATICHRMLDGTAPSILPDVRATDGIADLPSVRENAIGAYVGVPVKLSDGSLYGTLCCVDQQSRPGLCGRDQALLEFMAKVIAEDVERVARERRERRRLISGTGVGALVAALEARDQYTSEHSAAVVALAGAVARRIGLSDDEVLDVEQAAILHDIGKVGIPDSVLQKPGPLDESEWELMREHPAVGARIIARTESLAHLAPIIRAEHERWDGAGYPDGLRAAEIPPAARIVFACDAYHAMTSDRPYRKAMSREAALEELGAHAGSQFDPVVADAIRSEVLGHDHGSAPEETPPTPAAMLTVARPYAPAWEPVARAGSGVGLGQVRTECRTCGAHTTGIVGSTTLGGICGNCGGQELALLGS